MSFDAKTYSVSNGSRPATIMLIIGVVGLVLSAIGYFTDAKHFFHSYLVAFMFWLTIALGALFFTMLHHLVNAKWSVVIRRLSENVMNVIPIMAIFVIPILLGMHDLFHWTHAEEVAADPILQGKAGYLNTTFFVIRLIAYFVIWFFLTRLLYKTSMAQDEGGDQDFRLKLRKISAPGMLLFAVTVTFSSFDWLMSLDPHWYSTIFGPYVYSGSFLAALSFLVVAAAYQRKRGWLKDTITVEHFHDLGKLMFAFIIFWGYMAFSQYFLIWYANIPEETVWFFERWNSGWKSVSLVIIFGHFAIPFVALVFRATKRHVAALTTVSIWLLVMHWIDLYWLVFPNLYHSVHFSWMDITLPIGIGGIYLWWFWRKHVSKPLVPVKDPGLQRSIQFTNN